MLDPLYTSAGRFFRQVCGSSAACQQVTGAWSRISTQKKLSTKCMSQSSQQKKHCEEELSSTTAAVLRSNWGSQILSQETRPNEKSSDARLYRKPFTLVIPITGRKIQKYLSPWRFVFAKPLKAFCPIGWRVFTPLESSWGIWRWNGARMIQLTLLNVNFTLTFSFRLRF